MNCPTCGKPGYTPPDRGRPKELDDMEVAKLRAKGKSLREIAAQLGVTHGAIQASIKRCKGKG